MGGGCPKATPSITVVLGVGACWPQVMLGVPLATYGAVLWVPVTKLVVMPGVQQLEFHRILIRARRVHPRWWLSEEVSRHSDLSCGSADSRKVVTTQV